MKHAKKYDEFDALGKHIMEYRKQALTMTQTNKSGVEESIKQKYIEEDTELVNDEDTCLYYCHWYAGTQHQYLYVIHKCKLDQNTTYGIYQRDHSPDKNPNEDLVITVNEDGGKEIDWDKPWVMRINIGFQSKKNDALKLAISTLSTVGYFKTAQVLCNILPDTDMHQDNDILVTKQKPTNAPQTSASVTSTPSTGIPSWAIMLDLRLEKIQKALEDISSKLH